MGEDIRNLPNRDKEKLKYSTPRQERVTSMINKYKRLLNNKSEGIFHVFSLKESITETVIPQKKIFFQKNILIS